MVGDERIDAVGDSVGCGRAGLAARQDCSASRRTGVAASLSMSYLNPPGHPEIFICGDLAHVEENGRTGARGRATGHADGSLRCETDWPPHGAVGLGSDGTGREEPFHYFDKGDMATIGRKAAVANIQWPFKGHWSGFPAWMTWLVGSHLLPDRLSQPAVRLLAVGVDVSDLPRWASADHRVAGASGLEGEEAADGESDHQAAGYGFAKDLLFACSDYRSEAKTKGSELIAAPYAYSGVDTSFRA